MAPSKWSTDHQEALLLKHYDSYKRVKENQKSVPLTRFWDDLEKIFFAEFPAEAVLKLPTVPEGERRPPLTAEQLIVLGNATQLTQNRLKQWMRNRDQRTVNAPAESATAMSDNSLFQLLKKSKNTRPMRPVEKYQTLYHAKIQAAVKADLAATLDQTSSMGIPANVVVLDEHQAAAQKKKLRSERMSLWQLTAKKLYAAESDEVQREVIAATNAENIKRGEARPPAGAAADGMTPQSYQYAIDQIGPVYRKVHDMTKAKTGWSGILIMGGPMPRRGGQLSTKTICFGETASGNDFVSAIPDFDDVIKGPFHSWLKRVYPRDVRKARALPEDQGDDDEAPELPTDLLPMDPLPYHDTTPLQTGQASVASSSTLAPSSEDNDDMSLFDLPPLEPTSLWPESEDGLDFNIDLLPPSTFDYDKAFTEVCSRNDRDIGDIGPSGSTLMGDMSVNALGFPPPSGYFRAFGPPLAPRTSSAVTSFNFTNLLPTPSSASTSRPDADPMSVDFLSQDLQALDADTNSVAMTAPAIIPSFAPPPVPNAPIVGSPPIPIAPSPPVIPQATAFTILSQVVANGNEQPLVPELPLVPQFPQSRPMANAPQGHPLALITAAPAHSKKAAGRPRGRPRKSVGAISAENITMPVPAMSPAAQVETARINAEAVELRRQTAKQLQLSHAIDGVSPARPLTRSRMLANPPQETVFVVTRPKRTLGAGSFEAGIELIGESISTLPRRDDAVLLEALTKGKRKAKSAPAKSQAPAKKRARR
ncbi:hypothetical protein K438DRAFT_2027408 [Mycena galopus ATCC 62051]|nr:hypothetical protein K438DRAFT_2027408 [Mycena galopus ATCC 62051]